MSSIPPSPAPPAPDYTATRDRIVEAVNVGQVFRGGSRAADPDDERTWPRVPAAAVRAALLAADLQPDPAGLRFVNVVITGELDLSFLHAPCSIQFRDCRFDEAVAIENADLPQLDLAGSRVPALSLDGSTFQQGVLLPGLICPGTVSASLTNIDFGLDLNNARLGTDAGAPLVALDLNGSRVGGLLTVRDARIDGEVEMIETAAVNQVRFGNTTIAGSLTMDGAQFGSDFQGDRLRVNGQTRAVGTNFGADVDLTTGSFLNPRKDAILLGRARIGGALFLDRTVVHGSFDAHDVVAATMHMEGAVFAEQGARGAVVLDDARIGTLTLRPDSLDGELSMVRTTAASFETNASWPASSRLEGIHLTDVHGPMRTESDMAVSWLDRTDRAAFSPQPWHEFADFYDRIGRPTDAKRLRMGAAARVTQRAPLPTKVARMVYASLVGYGYRPLRPFLWLLCIALLALLCVTVATGEGFIPSAPTVARALNAPGWCPERTSAASAPACVNPSYTDFDPWTAALTLVTPAGAVSAPAWIPGALWLVVTLTVIKLAGWILTALLLAGVTGLLRKQ